MNYLQRLEYWGEHHHPRWMDLVRIALGLFLMYKGMEFLQNTSEMMGLMTHEVPFGGLALILLGHYIVFAHVAGGFLLALGVLTRFACLIQIPILVGAIIFINSSSEMMAPFSELLLSIAVLLLLLYFLVAGNGPWSLDWFFNEEVKEKKQRVDEDL